VVHCAGQHDEVAFSPSNVPQPPSRNILDFSFYIGYQTPSQVTQWTVADDAPVHRGHTMSETGIPRSATKANGAQIERFGAWSKERTARGLPPWISTRDAARYERGRRASAGSRPPQTEALRSSWTLRQWADNYCGSHSRFKEFVYEKARLRFQVRAEHYIQIRLTCAHDADRPWLEPQRAQCCDRRYYQIHGLRGKCGHPI
jgi:hypothetical protein